MPFQAQPTEKCTACSRTVYQTERAVVEEKTEKKVYHKTCIRCATCNKVLEVGQIASLDGKIWCKPHFKQLFASKGNFDEAFGKEKVPAKTTVISTPTSFVPETKNEARKDETKQTSEATLARFRKFREEGDSDRCVSCGKTVYLAEKMLVEDKNEKRLFHKTCFKCSVCNMILDLRNYGSLDGKIYCKNHLKEVGGLGKSASGSSSYVSGNASFIPPTQEERRVEKSQTPENIASKFKGIQGEAEKCKECNKTVYATEKVTVPGKQGGLFHKICFKCSVCSTKLDVTNYGSSNGILFCYTHLKQFGKPEQAKGDNAYFVSPLASTDKSYTPGPREENADQYDDHDDQRSQDSDNSSRQQNFRDSGRNSPAIERNSGRSSPAIERRDSGRNSPAIERRDSGRSSPAVERDSGRSSPAIQRDPEAEVEPQRQSEPEKPRSMSYSRSENVDDDQKRREEERQRKREERQRQIEAEEREQEEERERRKRERERRLQESASDPSSTSYDNASTSKETEREERRKRREEERRREEEEREREEEKRRKEREARKREQEEEAARELAEQEKKAEERKRRLAELKGEV